jgi:hypothetical protein
VRVVAKSKKVIFTVLIGCDDGETVFTACRSKKNLRVKSCMTYIYDKFANV